MVPEELAHMRTLSPKTPVREVGGIGRDDVGVVVVEVVFGGCLIGHRVVDVIEPVGSKETDATS